MLYRKLGKTDESVSILGFGCMRLPVINGEYNRINEPEAISQIRDGIDRGINYIDTAYPYHGGSSEGLVGKALSEGYRDKTFLATKLPSWLINSHGDMQKYLDEQLERLQTDRIDFYLVHSLKKEYWANLMKHDLLTFLENAKKSGKVRHVGFSFHDELLLFKEIVDSYDWEFCQVQYNFMDEDYQAGRKGIEYAAGKGLGIVIMEPLRGGTLARNVPDDIVAIWNRADVKRTPAEWALKFLWDNPEISVVLSGMNDMSQLKENINAAGKSPAGSLSEKEKDLIDEVKKIYRSRVRVNCTNCGYCMPCPAGVNIPLNFTHLNNAYMYGDVNTAKFHYNAFVQGNARASSCADCGSCEKECPQHIPVREVFLEVVEKFGA